MIQMGFDSDKCERAWSTFGNEEEALAWLCDNNVESEIEPVALKVSTKRKPK